MSVLGNMIGVTKKLLRGSITFRLVINIIFGHVVDVTG